MDAHELLKLVFVLADTTAADATNAKQAQYNTGMQMYFEGRADIMDCLIKAAGYRKEFEDWRNNHAGKLDVHGKRRCCNVVSECIKSV